MLGPEYLQRTLPEEVAKVYYEIEKDMLRDIARRLKGANYLTPTAMWEIEKARDMNILYDDLVNTIARYANMSEEAVERALWDAGIRSVEYDNEIYKRAKELGQIPGTPLPLEQAPYLQMTLEAGIENAKELMRLTNTRAVQGARMTFSEIVDKAYLGIQTGAMTFDQAMREAISELAQRGIKVVNYASGRSFSMEAAVRMNIITTANQTVAKIAERQFEMMGASLVETTSHAGARPSHAEWQGKVFWWKRYVKGYEEFESSTGYGTPGGLCGVNCYHSFYPYFKGISSQSFERDPARKHLGIDNDEYYELTQEQRRLERNVRVAKKEQVIAEEIGDDEAIHRARAKVRNAQAQVRKFISEHPVLERDYIRESIGR